RDILKTYLSDTEEVQLIGECKNSLEARTLLKEHDIDLIFLDINMPRLSGINFLKTLDHPPKVILTTAYSEYALESYELNVVDYLLKPFSFERFLKAVEIAGRTLSETNSDTEYITIKADGKLYRLHYGEILFAESQGDYLTVHTKNEKITFYQTLKDFCDRLPESQFVRIHRSYLVSLLHINFIEGNLVQIADHKLPIGNSYKEAVIQKYTA
ncbi:MAG TPA: DNA-binding response regulator, partial [Balneolaceae bacterium]|nr:DNA-binding response regulator [Balneolaceae bacterium]